MLALSPDTEALIRAKAAITGKTPDELIREVLQDVAANTAAKAAKPDIEAMKAIARRVARLPIQDTRDQKAITDEGWGM